MVCSPFFSTVFIAYTQMNVISVPSMVIRKLAMMTATPDSPHHMQI